jgi:hypothetical protein
MGAPTTPPSWCEPISDADRELDPFEQSAFYIDDFAEMPRYFPDWLVEEAGIEVRIHLMSREQGRHAEIGFVAAGRGGVVRFAQDPSGWLKLTAEFEGRPVFTGYLDHPYENCEIWPEGAEVDRKTSEAPGTVGKRKTWVGLDSRVWSALAPLCHVPGESVTFSVDESKLKAV